MLGVFEEFYFECLRMNERFFSGDGKLVELGAGVSLFKNYCPDLIVTDIVPAPHLDKTLNAQEMDFDDESVRAFFGLNCFHHFPRPELFFQQLQRTLIPGGGCVLIEPHYGPVSAAFHANVHNTEHFDKKQQGWQQGKELGHMTNANQALSYIVFKRDLEKFKNDFPDLELIYQNPIGNYLRYFFSGGLNFRQLLPDFMIAPVKLLEGLMSPIKIFSALHGVFVLRKRHQ